MTDRQTGQVPVSRSTRPTGSTFLRRLQSHTPSSTQVMGFLALLISGGILLFLTGLTLMATVLALIFFAPLIIISSPVWVPAGTVLFFTVAGFLSLCAFTIASAAAISWACKYVRGGHPPGSDQVDYARSRIADTASHVKDYAREYFHSKVKDAAPGA